MANARNLTALATAVVAVAILSSSHHAAAFDLFPELEVTLANDGTYPIWFMCQMTDKSNSLFQLQPNATYRFSFLQVAFPMRWCYLYVSPKSHGFFWAYTVRSRCTKCFWSINKHPSLYRGDKGRWERQKLFMPPGFKIDPLTNDKDNKPAVSARPNT
ncbi:hypothetical protein ACP275_02G037400 [Erythranthe tilingii]